MNNKDFDRKMEFIVNQQAQFAVDIERLKESQAQTEKNVAQNTKTAAQNAEAAARNAETAARNAETAAHTLEAVAQTAETVARLATVTFEGFKVTNAKIEALADSQNLTDEKLRNLIAVVDRHISERHKGA